MALIPAAGRGSRLGMGPKALLDLGGRTILERIMDTVEGLVDRIIIGAPESYLSTFIQIAGKRAEVLTGGDTRQETVYKLFRKTSAELILVHDVSWPFVSARVFEDVLLCASESGAASAVTGINVPLGRYENGRIREYLPKENCCLSQTPQAYSREVLRDSFTIAIKEGIEFQSLAQLVTFSGHGIDAVFVKEPGIKITYPLDMEIATRVIAPGSDVSKGSGKRGLQEPL